MSRPILGGSSDQSTVIRIIDSTDGSPETGVVAATAGLALWYRREGAAIVALTESDLAAADSAHADGGMFHLGDGMYRVDLPDAAVAAGVGGVAVGGTATGMVVIPAYHAINPPVDVRLVNGTAAEVETDPVSSNLTQILGTTLTETSAGYLAAALKKFLDVATPVFTAASVNQTGDSFARIGAPAGASVSVDIAAVKTDTGNLVTRITSTLFSGITSLAQWLGLIAGKQTGNSTARTEIRATGTGSGTYLETTDSLEAAQAAIASTSVIVTPLSSTVSAGQVSDTKITCYQHQAFGPYVLTITDSNSAAVNLSGKTLVFNVYRSSDPGTILFSFTSTDAEITVGGASNNQVTISANDDNMTSAGDFRWVLWDTTSDLVRARGVLVIEPEANSTISAY